MSSEFEINGPEFCAPVKEESLGKQIYENLSKSNPEEILFIHAVTEEKLTCRRFLDLSCRLAQSLQNCGYKRNDVISVSAENNNYFFVPVAAALYLGIVVAPLNHQYTLRELTHCAGITKPKIIFCSKAVAEKYLKLKNTVKFIDKIIIIHPFDAKVPGTDSLDSFIKQNSSHSSITPTDLNPFEQISVVLCSSGTTGLPKGVMTTHDNISVRIAHTRDPRYNIIGREVIFGLMPFFHGFGFMVTIAAIINRNMVVLIPRFDEDLFLRCIEKYKIDNIPIVPPIMIFLAKSPKVLNYNLSSVVDMICGAAPLSKELEMDVRKRLPNVKSIRQGYGLTESTLAVLLMPINESKSGSSGKVVAGMSCKVRDLSSGKSLGPNQVGELCFKGRMVTKGYYGNPEATRDTITKDGWLLTGDLGYYDEENYFYVVDRLKELIKYKGFQVAPAELEALLLTHPKIKDAAVVGLPDEEAGELALAFIVKSPNTHLTETEVKSFVAEQTSRPKHLHGGVRFVDAIPKNPTGKILRRELREMVKKIKSHL